MKTVKVPEDIVGFVPEVIKSLPADILYRLTKTETSGNPSLVFPGDYVVGDLDVVQLGEDSYGLRVDSGERSDLSLGYIRTSPVKEVLDSTHLSVTVRTGGGVYKLERVTDAKTRRGSSRA